MENTVFVLSTPEPNYPDENLVWCFDSPSEFLEATRLLSNYGMPYLAYHAVGRNNKPVNTTALNYPDKTWTDLSEGLNDAREVHRWVRSYRGEL